MARLEISVFSIVFRKHGCRFFLHLQQILFAFSPLPCSFPLTRCCCCCLLLVPVFFYVFVVIIHENLYSISLPGWFNRWIHRLLNTMKTGWLWNNFTVVLPDHKTYCKTFWRHLNTTSKYWSQQEVGRS